MPLSRKLFYGAVSNTTSDIPQDRPLTDEEADLVEWLIEHGVERAARFIREIENLRVVSRCGCGCASVDFGHSSEPLDILSDYQWQDEQGRVFGAFVFARADRLAGLEVWSIDGQATPTSLPAPALLVPVVGAP